MSRVPPITNVSWDCNVTLSRREIHALARLASFVGNIESEYGGKSDFRKGDFNEIRSAMHKFVRVKQADDDFVVRVTNPKRMEVRDESEPDNSVAAVGGSSFGDQPNLAGIDNTA